MGSAKAEVATPASMAERSQQSHTPYCPQLCCPCCRAGLRRRHARRSFPAPRAARQARVPAGPTGLFAHGLGDLLGWAAVGGLILTRIPDPRVPSLMPVSCAQYLYNSLTCLPLIRFRPPCPRSLRCRFSHRAPSITRGIRRCRTSAADCLRGPCETRPARGARHRHSPSSSPNAPSRLWCLLFFRLSSQSDKGSRASE